jgi:hypothetical protein
MSTSEEAGVTVNEMLQKAEQAQAAGVPVDWRAIAYNVANAATNYIANMEAQKEPETEE